MHSGLCVALLAHQGSCIGQAHVWRSVALEVAGHDGFRGADAFSHQLQRQQGQIVGRGGQRLRGLRSGKCSHGVVGSQAHAADGTPGDGAQRRIVQRVLQGLFHDRGRQRLVAGSGVELRYRLQCGRFVRCGRVRQFLAQRLCRVAGAVEGHQDLQQEAIGVARLGLGVFPGAHCCQGRVSRACLQRDFHCAAVQGAVVAAAGSVEHERVPGAGVAGTRREFAQQHFVEQFSVQGLSDRLRERRRPGWRAAGGLCPAGQRKEGQGPGQMPDAKKMQHQPIIIQAPSHFP